jgi:hypothetical protein
VQWVVLTWGLVAAAIGGWFLLAMVALAPRRERLLVDALLGSDHDDWWAFMTGGDIVGGGSRPDLAFRVLSGSPGRGHRSCVCAFDGVMFIRVGLTPLPWDPDHRSASAGWLKGHARFRVDTRTGGDVLVEMSDRRRFRMSASTSEAVTPVLMASGWLATDHGTARP